MRKFWKWIFCLAAVLLLAVPASAANETNREAGYFDNTRTVLLLPAAGRNGYTMAWMDKQLSRIFRYPYYRLVETDERIASPGEMQAAAVGARISRCFLWRFVLISTAGIPCSATETR